MPLSSNSTLQAVQDVMALLEDDVPPVPEAPTEADIEPWRDRIDALDRAILQLFNERSICANAIGHIKKQLGLPIYVPQREQEVLQNVVTSNKGPLPDEAVRHLFERVIDETRSLERHLYQDDGL